jgi:2-dehydropantoate 2-reductase
VSRSGSAPPFRILVVGAGAVGGYFGARLVRGGCRVTFVARGANLQALRARGLVVHLPDETLRIAPVDAVDDPARAERPDLVLVCVKSYDTAAVAVALRPAVGPETIVLSLQNGVENEETLARLLGLPPLLVGFTRIGVELSAPGEIRYTARGAIYFGEADGHESARAVRLRDALGSAGIPCELRPDVVRLAWEKLAWNAGFNAVTTLTDRTVAEALALPESRDVIARAMEECDATATALGIAVDRSRLPRVFAEEEAAGGLAGFVTSMLQDRRRGRRLEHDALNGAVVRAAARVGVAVPVNRTLLGLLARLDPG